MIKKIQRNVTLLVLGILSISFILIYLAGFVIYKQDTKREIYGKLNNLVKIYQNTNSASIDNLFSNTFDDTVFILSNGFKVYVKQDFNDDIYNKIIDESNSSSMLGNYDNYYFLNYNENGYNILLCADMTKEISSLNTKLIEVLLIITVIYCVFAIILYGVSFKIIRPIEKSFAQQRQFVSNVSHELKTPITVISANAEVLKNVDNNKWVINILSQTERMEVLVNDMLTLSKIEEDRVPLSLEEFNLADAIVSTALSFDALAFEQGKNLVLNIPDKVDYKGDSASVKKLVNILLDNAIKYSSNKGNVIVTLKNEIRPTLIVYNDGSEIEENEANKIFERFYRGDNSRSRTTGGSGLGLAIAKGIADSNNWKISAKSIKTVSMTITVVL